MGSTYFMVDIQTIWRAANGDDLCTQLVKHFGSNMVGRAMGSIYNDLEAFESELRRESAFTKLDVTASSIVKPFGFA